MRSVSDNICRENRNTHFTFNNFFFENSTVCEIMWKNMVEPDRPQVTIWCMHISCCIANVMSTNSEYVILIAFPQQRCLHECTSVLRCMCIACLVFMKKVITTVYCWVAQWKEPQSVVHVYIWKLTVMLMLSTARKLVIFLQL